MTSRERALLAFTQERRSYSSGSAPRSRCRHYGEGARAPRASSPTGGALAAEQPLFRGRELGV
jgi:hypothetical protein